MYLYVIETASDFWGVWGVRSGKKVSQQTASIILYHRTNRSLLPLITNGKQPGNKNQKPLGYTIENDYHLHLLTREVISCPCLTHTQSNHLPNHLPAYFFAVLLDRLNALAVGAPFDPGLRIRSPLPAAMRLRFF